MPTRRQPSVSSRQRCARRYGASRLRVPAPRHVTRVPTTPLNGEQSHANGGHTERAERCSLAKQASASSRHSKMLYLVNNQLTSAPVGLGQLTAREEAVPLHRSAGVGDEHPRPARGTLAVAPLRKHGGGSAGLSRPARGAALQAPTSLCCVILEVVVV